MRLNCRAKVSPTCKDGVCLPDWEIKDDGTFKVGTIVCDSCYIAIMPFTPSGRALHGEIDTAIDTVQAYEAEVLEQASEESYG